MRPSLYFIQQKFREFNLRFFNNLLVEPKIILNLRLASVGRTVVKRNMKTGEETVHIEISIRENLPEEEYIDTILHEMIHYWIYSNRMVDDAPHGILFHDKAHEISKISGYKITDFFEPDLNFLLQSDYRVRFVMVYQKRDDWFISVVSRNKVLEVNQWIKKDYEIENLQWFVSNRRIFSTIPVSAQGIGYPISKEDLDMWLNGLIPLDL